MLKGKKTMKKMTALLLAACLVTAAAPINTQAAVRSPIATGTTTYGNDKVTIDASNTDQGYVMIKWKDQDTDHQGDNLYIQSECKGQLRGFPVYRGERKLFGKGF